MDMVCKAEGWRGAEQGLVVLVDERMDMTGEGDFLHGHVEIGQVRIATN